MVPLFDRLGMESGSFEGLNKNYLTPVGVEQSVMLELNRLVSTRSKLTFDEYIKSDLTVLDYGLPDFIGYSIQNDDHRMTVKAAVVKAIETFEPRLKKINITIFTSSNKKFVSYFGVEANLVIGKQFQRVSFVLNKENKFSNSTERQDFTA
jgi:type VI secretion system lysozyme-like protein